MSTNGYPQQWVWSAWAGGLFGGTLWMLLAAILSYRFSPVTAVQLGGIFLAAILIGIGLWKARASIHPNLGVQILLGILGLLSLLCIYILDRAGLYEKIQIGSQISAQSSYMLILFLFPALMLFLYFRLRPQTTE